MICLVTKYIVCNYPYVSNYNNNNRANNNNNNNNNNSNNNNNNNCPLIFWSLLSLLLSLLTMCCSFPFLCFLFSFVVVVGCLFSFLFVCVCVCVFIKLVMYRFLLGSVYLQHTLIYIHVIFFCTSILGSPTFFTISQ